MKLQIKNLIDTQEYDYFNTNRSLSFLLLSFWAAKEKNNKRECQEILKVAQDLSNNIEQHFIENSSLYMPNKRSKLLVQYIINETNK